jgi:hypothetical protein
MPEVNNKDQSCLFSIVPCLVLKTIVKYICFSFLLMAGFITHSHSTTTHPSYGKMESQLLIGGSVVLHDVGVSCKGTDEGVVIVVGNMFVNHLHDEGHLLAVVIEFHIVKLKVEYIPLPTVD